MLLKKSESNPENMYNVYKSDVFTLGMIILSLARWKPCSDIYDYKTCVLNTDLLE